MKENAKYIVSTDKKNNLTINGTVISEKVLEQNALGYQTKEKDSEFITYLTISTSGSFCRVVPGSYIWLKMCSDLINDQLNAEKTLEKA